MTVPTERAVWKGLPLSQTCCIPWATEAVCTHTRANGTPHRTSFCDMGPMEKLPSRALSLVAAVYLGASFSISGVHISFDHFVLLCFSSPSVVSLMRSLEKSSNPKERLRKEEIRRAKKIQPPVLGADFPVQRLE